MPHFLMYAQSADLSRDFLQSRDSCTCPNDVPSDGTMAQAMAQEKWTVDSRSLGIGIAIGLVLATIIAAVISLISVSMRKSRPKSSRARQTRSRTTLTTLGPLTFSAPASKFTSSKPRSAPLPAGRLSLDSQIDIARSEPPETVLDIAPRKAREPSPSTPSTQLEPQSHFDVDLEEMRATNTFSGQPTLANINDVSGSSRQRPNSSPTEGSTVDSFGFKTPKPQPRHKRLSTLESDAAKPSASSVSLTSASEVVRRVQSDDFIGSSSNKWGELYPRPGPSKLDLELEMQRQWGRPRGMGHTLPRPQTAKTVSSRTGIGGQAPQTPGGATGMASSSSLTPFSSASSLGLALNNSNGTSPTTSGSNSNSISQYPPQPILPNSKEAELSIDTSNIPTPRQHKRRRKRDKGSESSLGLSKPSPALLQESYIEPSSDAHNHGLEISPLANPHGHQPLQRSHSRPLPQHPQQSSEEHMNTYDQDQDIAPPPYNIANVHSNGPGPGNQMLIRLRERSDSRSGEMGFGQSHHARNHLL